MNDRRLLWGATIFLFVICAAPLLVVDVPPLQDLPAHLATSVVIRHIDAYPDFIFRGFFKTNSTLFLWLHIFGESHLVFAAKAFIALTLFTHAWVLPRFVYEFGGRDRVIVATFLAGPLVHSWFVAMGMLDYALASGFALICLLLLARQSKEATRARFVALFSLGILVWYTHMFALGMVLFLGALEAIRTRSIRALRTMLPLAPGAALSLWSVIIELVRAHAPSTHGVTYRPPWETVYELWAKYAWSFTKLEILSIATTIVLAISLVRDRKLEVPFLSTLGVCVLLVLHFAVPSEAFDWFAVNSRVLPFLYAAALIRVPEKRQLPVMATGVLAACALTWGIGLALDYMRLDREYKEATTGEGLIPEGADLVPIIYDPKGSSENTWALVNVWGLYVASRHTSAPLLFAHSPSFPIGYRDGMKSELPDASFAQETHDAESWKRFAESLRTHEWILEWGAPPPEAIAPPAHVLLLERGRLRLWRPE